ncbi:MAG: MmgE/PrpD family protein [Verrucomicrobia bacterium]|nr:MmgE/PrpD family protein [Verrucomicrobiota bacterium]
MEREVERLAAFVQKREYSDLSEEAVQTLKIRVLDSLGCAFGALNSPVIAKIREHTEDFGGKPLASLIGGGKTSPDRAAFYNGACIRYLDFNDSFLAKHETCHPSDNIGALLAASEYAGASGKEFLTALAVSYQVQCRLSEEAPVRKKGFDHTTQGSYAAAAGAAKALRLTAEQTANAIAISAVSNNALRVTRTGALSHWKGLAYPNTGFSATHAAFLAMRGITGPLEIFEGNKGFIDAISGPFTIQWDKEDLEIVRKTIIKKYNAEIHSQSTLEGILELREKQSLQGDAIEHIEVDIFDVAYNIIGGGEEGGKKEIRTKEEADHSLPYMIAVALLDGEVTPAQYLPARIVRDDVQHLLQKITIRPKPEFTQKFPQEMRTLIQITMKDGKKLTLEKKDYEGFFTKPMSWEHALDKFHRLSAKHVDETHRHAIAEAVLNLEAFNITVLTKLFGV